MKRARKLAVILGILLGVSGAILVAARFASPQLSRWVFVYQVYYCGVQEAVWEPPASHTGCWKTWYSNGKQHSQATYSNGRRTGQVRYWHKNGCLEVEHCYVNGTLTGQWNRWFDDGTIAARGEFDKQGRKHGRWEAWHRNGQKKMEVVFAAGSIIAPEKWWRANGVLRHRPSRRIDREQYTDEVDSVR